MRFGALSGLLAPRVGLLSLAECTAGPFRRLTGHDARLRTHCAPRTSSGASSRSARWGSPRSSWPREPIARARRERVYAIDPTPVTRGTAGRRAAAAVARRDGGPQSAAMQTFFVAADSPEKDGKNAAAEFVSIVWVDVGGKAPTKEAEPGSRNRASDGCYSSTDCNIEGDTTLKAGFPRVPRGFSARATSIAIGRRRQASLDEPVASGLVEAASVPRGWIFIWTRRHIVPRTI